MNNPAVQLMDGARGVSDATLAAGARLLGDAFEAAAFTGMTDASARHELVRRKLGDAAAGKSAAFLDGAWRAFTGDTSASTPVAAPEAMTDAQRAYGRAGVRLALADLAKRGATPGAGRDAAAGAYDAMRVKLADGWKGDVTPGPVLDAKQAQAELRQRLSDGWKGAA